MRNRGASSALERGEVSLIDDDDPRRRNSFDTGAAVVVGTVSIFVVTLLYYVFFKSQLFVSRDNFDVYKKLLSDNHILDAGKF